ncbi:UNVERIFIED_CONTAM: hypothetical protein PYX00_004812 [Menopon gallinae]|uniref:RETREG1-3/ARL6IP-like N-terminal reticulon-homology domain-containing protein n=1 Tax=Menopon gallinae TaxID=328185 RepID=A0AAW2I654_9NEOP
MASMTPDFLSKILFSKKSPQNPVEANSSENGVTKRDWILDEIEEIVVWDNPLKSLLSLVGVNVLFWLLINVNLKFYGLIFIALLVISLNQLWNEYFQSSVTNDPDSGRESAASCSSSSSGSRFEVRGLVAAMKNACLKLKQSRQDQPGTFFFAAFASFLFLNFIGRTVSGATLTYTLLMAVMIVPGILKHLIPLHVLSSSVQHIYSSHKGVDSQNKLQQEDKFEEEESFRELMLDSESSKVLEKVELQSLLNEPEKSAVSSRLPADGRGEQKQGAAQNLWQVANDNLGLNRFLSLFASPAEAENVFMPEAIEVDEGEEGLLDKPEQRFPADNSTFLLPEDDEEWMNFSSDSDFEVEEEDGAVIARRKGFSQKSKSLNQDPRQPEVGRDRRDFRNDADKYAPAASRPGATSEVFEIQPGVSDRESERRQTKGANLRNREDLLDEEDSFSELTSDTESPDIVERIDRLQSLLNETTASLGLSTAAADGATSAAAPARLHRDSSSDTDGFELINDEDM